MCERYNSMVLQTKKIERDWILLTYDVSTEINDERDRFREALIKEMGALYQNDSVYLLPKKIHSINEIKEFAKNYDVNIVIFGLDADIKSCKSISKKYVHILHQRRQDVKDTILDALDAIAVVKSNLEDESLTGFHNKLKEIDMLFEHFEGLCTKYGNKHDEWKIKSLRADVQKVKKRYNEVNQMKKRIKK